ncbi:MAG: energy-coupled thiamine transporter ThiT [Firmicutes bacterium]|nr:energy-coupled thiamine transporter ThiT [Bacillota bacterium]
MVYIMNIFKKFGEFKEVTLIVLALLILVPVSIILLKKMKKLQTDSTRVVVYGGLCIALSFVLSYVRLYHWPQGGSVTPASMLPMIFFAVAFGPVAGIVAGIAYGFLQLIQDPYILHWAQVFLDYPLAFGAIGLAGLYRNNLPVSALIGGAGRFAMHFISGIIFFGSYAPEGMNVMLYSLMVNGLVIGTDTLICVVVSLLPGFAYAAKRIRKMSAM